MQFTRRDFLKLSGLALGAATLLSGRVRGWAPPSPEGEGDTLQDNTEAIAEFLSGQVERAFQADSLPGANIFVAGNFIPWDKVLSGDQEERDQFKIANAINNIVEDGFVPAGTVLTVPDGTGFHSDQETIARRLYRQLMPRLVMTPGVSPEKQFLPREFDRLNDALHRIVMPYLERNAPKTATTGLVLLGRAPDGLAASYAEDPSHTAVSHFEYVQAGPNAFSYVRDENGDMVLKSKLDGKVLVRRIYFLREPSEELKTKMSASGGFLMSPEWGAYYFGTMGAQAHELMHSIVTRDYNFPPFDNHSVVRAESFACVLDYLHSGKGKWKQGSLPEAVWSMPELEVLKAYPTFYKDLFVKLREGKGIGTIAFDEAEVVAVSDALFANQTLGSFHERWDQWKGNYDTMTHGQPIDEKDFTFAMSKLGEENAEKAYI